MLTPRSEADDDDAAWVRAILTCVMAHSEQICVNLLTALGVPMEGGADLDAVSLPVGVPDTDLAPPEIFTTCAGGPLPYLRRHLTRTRTLFSSRSYPSRLKLLMC
jgi:hypothetical protein